MTSRANGAGRRARRENHSARRKTNTKAVHVPGCSLRLELSAQTPHVCSSVPSLEAFQLPCLKQHPLWSPPEITRRTAKFIVYSWSPSQTLIKFTDSLSCSALWFFQHRVAPRTLSGIRDVLRTHLLSERLNGGLCLKGK